MDIEFTILVKGLEFGQVASIGALVIGIAGVYYQAMTYKRNYPPSKNGETDRKVG
ncbi:MAG: hypothetical protein ACQEU4_07655 [Bacillota bacterium]